MEDPSEVTTEDGGLRDPPQETAVLQEHALTTRERVSQRRPEVECAASLVGKHSKHLKEDGPYAYISTTAHKGALVVTHDRLTEAFLAAFHGRCTPWSGVLCGPDSGPLVCPEEVVKYPIHPAETFNTSDSLGISGKSSRQARTTWKVVGTLSKRETHWACPIEVEIGCAEQ